MACILFILLSTIPFTPYNSNRNAVINNSSPIPTSSKSLIKSSQHLYDLPYELSTTPFPLILLVSQIPNFGPILATPSIQKSISSLFYQ